MIQDKRHPLKELAFAYQLTKRLIDITLGAVLLLFSLPIILVAAVAIRLETKGNPFFLQKRIGIGGKPFTIVKLRGMYADAKVRFAHLYDYRRHPSLDFHFHAQQDPRVTRVGAFIRRTSIDELPNFINVVAGQMSMVGPRPEVPDMLALYGDYEAAYLSVKPGVTCISKISGRDNLSKLESIKMDLGYLDDMSNSCDLSIMWRTLRGVLLRKNVYDGKLNTQADRQLDYGPQLSGMVSSAQEQVGSL